MAPGGHAQLLGNWMHVRGEDWRERVGSWAQGNGCDVWFVQRDVQDPAEYVGLWLSDANEQRTETGRQRYDAWLQWLEDHNVEGIGFGFMLLKRTESEYASVVIDEVTQPLAPPLGETVTNWFDRQDLLRTLSDDEVLATRWKLAADITLEQVAQRDPDGDWAVLGQVLRQESGVRWREDVDQLVATLVVGCDGQQPLADLLTVAAAAFPLDLGVEHETLLSATAAAARHLATRGFLTT